MSLKFQFLIYLVFSIALSASLSVQAQSRAAKTFERAKAGKAIEPNEIQTAKGRVVEFTPNSFTAKDIPASIRPLFRIEKINERYQDPVYFYADLDMDILGPYDPAISKIVYAPYIPMPKTQFDEYLVASDLAPEVKRALFFKDDAGREWVRYFIHPTKTSAYSELIEKYGIVRDEYIGFLGASPRSMYVWNSTDPKQEPFVVKSSLHYTIEGSLRINIPQKAARSHLVSEIFASIRESVKQELNFDYMPESVALLPAHKATATIYRSLPKDMLKGSRKIVPGFYLSGINPATGKTLLEDLLKDSPNPEQAAAELLRPLLKVSAYLMFKEGLKGELHEQNVYFELNSNNRLTGKIYIKDLDGFRVDAELRLRQGKSLKGLRDIFKPFIYSKFSKASGWGNDGAGFDHEVFDSFIKHTFGYSFCRVLKCGSSARREIMYEAMNGIMAEEAARVTGLPVNPNSMGGVDENQLVGLQKVAERYRANLNETVNYNQLSSFEKSAPVQRALRENFLKLRRAKRASSFLGNPNDENVYYRLFEDVIEARRLDPLSRSEESVGIASLYPESHAWSQDLETRITNLKRAFSGERETKIEAVKREMSGSGSVCRFLMKKGA
jgi:hypothetical protein